MTTHVFSYHNQEVYRSVYFVYFEIIKYIHVFMTIKSMSVLLEICNLLEILPQFFTPQPLRAVGVLFSPMVSGWTGRAGGRAAGNSLSGLYLRNRKV